MSGEKVGQRLHIHILNTPDLAGYWTPPAKLRRRLQGLAQKRKLSLTISESRDATLVSPTMRRANVLVGFRIPHHRIDEMPELHWIHLISAGVDHLLPLDWLPRRIAMTNSTGVHTDLAGDYAAGALLMLNFRVPGHAYHQRSGHWRPILNAPIRGKTVVLIGLGAIGAEAARRAKQLGLRVLGVRKQRRPNRYVDELYRPEDLPRILPKADFVLITAALTPETRGMIGGKELALLKPEAGLINMSRAALVDYDALRERLENGKLRGAIVDVANPEPLPADSPLWRVKNLMITPHISSDPVDYVERCMSIIADNVERFVTRRRVRNRVDVSLGY